MPTLIVPNSYGTTTAFWEFNKCHAPASGEFCSAPDSIVTRERMMFRRDHPGVAARADEIQRTGKTREERRYAEFLAYGEIISNRQLRGGDSKSQHLDPQGAYTAERAEQHYQILKKILADGVRVDHPTAIFIGGMTAAGKTTTVEAGLNKKGKVYINADAIKKMFPEYNGKNAAFLHEESGDLADLAVQLASERGFTLIFDATMKSLGGSDYQKAAADGGLAAKLEKLRARGYRLEARFVDVSVEVALKRSIVRFVREELKDGKGRFVPPAAVRSNAEVGKDFSAADKARYGNKPRRTFELAKHRFDAYLVLDNRVSGKPRLISRKGRLTT